jgi:UDP-3-O-[3-hydroxymyristoyl] glucosamine N-acyltransferase
MEQTTPLKLPPDTQSSNASHPEKMPDNTPPTSPAAPPVHSITLGQLAAAIDAQLVGDPSIPITGVSTLEDARPGDVSFLHNPRYAKQLAATKASAVIVAPAVNVDGIALLKSKEPYFAYRNAIVALYGFRKHPHAGAHPLAYVDPTAVVGPGTVIYPFVYVGPRAKIGADCILYPNCCVYDHCVLGDRVILQAGTVIGPDGFGYATKNGQHYKIPHVGNVIVEDDVEIGGNCVVQRAAMGSTIVGAGSKTGDLVNIGHAAKLGAHSFLVSQAGLGGSSTTGKWLQMGAQSGIAPHLKIGERVAVGARSGVLNHVPDGAVMIGSPAVPTPPGRRVLAILQQLPKLLERIRTLEKRLGAEVKEEDEKHGDGE